MIVTLRNVSLGLLVVSCGCHATEIKTTHYLGVFDPAEQVPQELYKITIQGRASSVSNVKYATGWVPAAQADLLQSDLRHDDSGAVKLAGGDSGTVSVGPRRRFFEIGPTGVSTEPDDGRFVIVMGSDPDYFFRKMGLLTRFGKDDSAAASSVRALADQVRAKRVDAAKATTSAVDQRSQAAANNGGAQ